MSDEIDDSSKNRRQELRFRGHSQRVTWHKAESEPTSALLCDFSASGASVVVNQRKNHRIEPGEQIALRTSSDSQDRIYEIRRVQQMGLGYALAGCCRSNEVESPIRPLGYPDLSTFAAPPQGDASSARRKKAADQQNLSSIAQRAIKSIGGDENLFAETHFAA